MNRYLQPVPRARSDLQPGTIRRSVIRPPTETASELVRLYAQYQNASVLEALATDPVLRADYQKSKNYLARQIEQRRTVLELRNYDRVSRSLNAIHDLHPFDFNSREFRSDEERYFYNPLYAKQIRSILRNVTHRPKPGSEEVISINPDERARHWIRHLRVISEGAFGRTFKAGLNQIDDYFAIKIPTIAGADQRHEFLVGIEVNKLRDRSLSPNFVYTYSFLTCTAPKIRAPKETTADMMIMDDDTGKRVSGWCAATNLTANRTDYLVLENVPNQGSMGDFFVESTSFSPEQFWSSILQVIVSLSLAQKEIGFNQWDLHRDNILMRPVAYNSRVYYPYSYRGGKGLTINTFGILPTIFDFGLSSYRLPAESMPEGATEPVHIGPNLNTADRTSCYFVGEPFPLADVYRLIHNLYYGMVSYRLTKNPNRDEIIAADALEYALQPFFRFNDLGDNGSALAPANVKTRLRAIRDRIIRGDRNAREELRDFGFLALAPNMKQFTIDDYLNFLLVEDANLKAAIPWDRIVSIGNPSPNGTVLSCHAPFNCVSDPRAVEARYPSQLSTYYDLDLYRVTIDDLNKEQVERMAIDTLSKLKTQENMILTSLSDLQRRTRVFSAH